MQPSKLRSLSEAGDVIDLRQRIEYWRSTRMKRGRMPEDLWAEATRLARRHGVWAISKLLRLNFEALKAWTESSSQGQASGGESRARSPRAAGVARNAGDLVVRKAPSVASPTFVRLDPLPAIPAPCSSVEVQGPGGTKMIIHLSGSTAFDAVALVEAFLGRHR